jgi:DNA-binding CsgD family transcriptional regulator
VTGILAEFASLTPSWEQLTWAWAVRVREENAMRERSRVAPRVARSGVVGSHELSPAQKREIVWRTKRGASSIEVARRMGLSAPAVRAYLAARSS